jgi:hypothetical protein
MQDKLIYEYAVLRLVPKVEREEFINIGIILFCKKQNYLNALSHLDEVKIKAICSDIDIDDFKSYLAAFHKIVDGIEDGGPIAQFDVPSRFRWLSAKRSTILQTSPTHSGLTEDLDATLQKLFSELV